MIASLPELSPGWPTAAGPLPSAPAAAAEGMGLDFGGLLDAAIAPPALAAPPSVPTPQPLPTGKIVPEEGASLPPVMLAAVPAEAAPAPVLAATAPVPPRAAAPRDNDGAAGRLSIDTVEQLPMPAAVVLDPGTMPNPADDPADPAAPPQSQAEESAPASGPASGPASDPVLPSDPAVLAALLPAPAAPPVSVPATVRLHRAELLAPADQTDAPMPARVTLPSSSAEDTSEVQTDSAPAPASASAPTPALLPAGDSVAQSMAQPAPSPAQPAPMLAAQPPALATPAPDRIEAPRAPAPQQETAIAQVGDLREALRSARPEMTLRHAEFGFVSLRLEQPAPEQWRAVLASRDPGFVPAIQAALAERAVAAAGASADTGHFMGQNGTSDQRYGASPNGGQGGLSPYMSQSGGRDGEAAPDHRRPSTAAALAARGKDGEAEASGSDTRGLFA